VSDHPAVPLAGRRRWCLGAAALLGLAGCGTPGRRPPAPVAPGAGVVPFSASPLLGQLPVGWQEQVMRRDKPVTRYQTAQRDGRTVLHALAERASSGLRCDVDIDPADTPWLEWEWRVDALATAATVAVDELDDSPARVVVAFDGDRSTLSWRELAFQDQVEAFTGYTLPFATLMYVWDGQAPLESVFAYPRTARIRYLVVETGEANTGRWLGHRRNVVDDYRRVFGGEPGRIRSVGVLTDSDDLRTRSEAWYGDLEFVAAPG
jgi:hypothetical protein